MLKKTIVYENPFTQETVAEEHYFHISKADLVEMEMEEYGAEYRDKQGNELTGMQAKLQRIVDSEDGKAIMSELKEMIRRSYGKKDGDRFLKSQAIWEEFSSTEAFSQLIFELCTDADAASGFISGIVPGNLDQVAQEVREMQAEQQRTAPGQPAEVTGLTTPDSPALSHSEDRARLIAEATPEKPVALTRSEVVEMDDAKLRSGVADGRFKFS